MCVSTDGAEYPIVGDVALHPENALGTDNWQICFVLFLGRKGRAVSAMEALD
ncbi:MAG: hypothetical protein HUJ51_05165 [Eggerthellaceae bacterium]|nr:hypothetical protein [Eggerthellaceae bacterium]